MRSAQPARGASFGAALGAVDRTLVVGSPGAGPAGAEVFHRAGEDWASLGVLPPGPGAAPGDRGGATVAAAGPWIAVGRPRARGATGRPGAGAVDLYLGRAAGLLPPRVDTLSPPDLPDGAGFGEAMAFGKDPSHGRPRWLAVAAPWSPSSGPGSALTPLVGEVHLFELVGERWIRRHVVGSPDPSIAQGFGTALAFAGRWVLVGAPGDGRTSPGAGRVFLVDAERGLLVGDADLSSIPGGDPGGAGARLGSAIAVLGKGTFVVSAPGRGRILAAVVRHGGLALSDLVVGPAIQGYGDSLAARGALLVVGAPRAGADGAPPFVDILVRRAPGPEAREGWSIARRVTWWSGHRACGPAQQDHDPAIEFGRSLCLTDRGLAVGAPGVLDVHGRARVGAVRWLDPAPLLR